jgi:DNA replication protein DnaC
MLAHPTLTKLASLRLDGMAAGLREQLAAPEKASDLSFEERLGLLVDREVTARENARLAARLKRARLRQLASIEDIDLRKGRGLDRSLILSLASCDWIRRHHNVIVTGPTGVGKSFIACALGHRACLDGFRVAYHRLGRLLEDLQLARGDGRYLKLLRSLQRTDVLILDDWGLAAVNATQQRDLLELLDDRHQQRSTVVTSQLPPAHWHEAMADPTLADAILDRLIHNAHNIQLTGDSMRKQLSTLQSAQANPHEADHPVT